MANNIDVKKSSIHGRGVFASRRVARNQFIGEYAGRRTRKNGRYVLWITGENGSAYGVEGSNSLRYLNHSSRPNAEFDGVELYSTRVIRPNDEITIHYGDDWDDV